MNNENQFVEKSAFSNIVIELAILNSRIIAERRSGVRDKEIFKMIFIDNSFNIIIKIL